MADHMQLEWTAKNGEENDDYYRNWHIDTVTPTDKGVITHYHGKNRTFEAEWEGILGTGSGKTNSLTTYRLKQQLCYEICSKCDKDRWCTDESAEGYQVLTASCLLLSLRSLLYLLYLLLAPCVLLLATFHCQLGISTCSLLLAHH